MTNIEDLIAASSLGTPDAVAMRNRTTPELARRIMARARQIGAIRTALLADPGFGDLDEHRRVVDVAIALGVDPAVVRRELDEMVAEGLL